MNQNPLNLRRIHHLEFWVGNAKQAAFFYRNAFGFSQSAYRGLESGSRDRASYLLSQGESRFMLTSPLESDSEISEHIARHGDGVKDIAFEVEDAEAAYRAALERGAVGAIEPYEISDEHGTAHRAAVRTYGETIHSFISKRDYDGPFLPGFQANAIEEKGIGILRVDHVVGNVELGKMNEWADWYSNVLGFERFITFDDKDISTDYTALMSVVMSDNSYSIKFPINEPAQGRKKSQIEEYLDFYEGPGVQHIALLSDDIIRTVTNLQKNGIDFLYVPKSYYEALPERVGSIEEGVENLQPLGILADRDEEGYLLQIFTKPVEDRPTLFFEIIERKGSRGFGKGNFKALFESIEREQELRGTL